MADIVTTTITVLGNLMIKEAGEYEDPNIKQVIFFLKAFLAIDQPADRRAGELAFAAARDPEDGAIEAVHVVDAVEEGAVEPVDYQEPVCNEILDDLVDSLGNLSISILEATPQPCPRRRIPASPPPLILSVSPPPPAIPGGEEPAVVVTNHDDPSDSGDGAGYSRGNIIHGKGNKNLVPQLVMLGTLRSPSTIPTIHIEHVQDPILPPGDGGDNNNHMLRVPIAVQVEERRKLRLKEQREKRGRELRDWQQKLGRGKYKQSKK